MRLKPLLHAGFKLLCAGLLELSKKIKIKNIFFENSHKRTKALLDKGFKGFVFIFELEICF